MSWIYWLIGFIGIVLALALLLMRTSRQYEEDDARWRAGAEFHRNYESLSELLVGAVEKHGVESTEVQELIRRLIAAQMKYAETYGVESEKTIGVLISLLPPKPR